MAEMKQMKDLTADEADQRIDSLSGALASDHLCTRTNAEYAVIALLKHRNKLAPPQLPAVPEGVNATPLGEEPVPATQFVQPLGSAAIMELLALEEALSYQQAVAV